MASSRGKQWPKAFLSPAEHMPLGRNQLFEESEGHGDHERDLLERFLLDPTHDFYDLDESVESRQVKALCAENTLRDLRAEGNDNKASLVAWIGITSCHPCDLQHQNLPSALTARQYHEKLKELKLSDNGKLENALTIKAYANINSLTILALAHSATRQEQLPLMNAICRHLDFRPSIAVQFLDHGLETFQLMLHLPYFILRQTRRPKGETIFPTDVFPPELPAGNWPSREVLDISFLAMPPLCADGAGEWKIYGTKFSFLINGFDQQRWNAYGFGDPFFDGPFSGMDPDDVVMDQNDGKRTMVDMEKHPREYYIRTLEARITLIGKSWALLASALMFGIKDAIKKHPVGGSALGQKQMRAFEDLAQEFEGVLQKLQSTLSSTLKEWAKFKSKDGDIGYFSDLHMTEDGRTHRVGSWLRSIGQIFDALQQTQDEFDRSKELCEAHVNKLRREFESMATQESKHATTMGIGVWAPITITATLFSMNEDAPIKLTTLNFALVLVLFIFIAIISIPCLKWASGKIEDKVLFPRTWDDLTYILLCISSTCSVWLAKGIRELGSIWSRQFTGQAPTGRQELLRLRPRKLRYPRSWKLRRRRSRRSRRPYREEEPDADQEPIGDFRRSLRRQVPSRYSLWFARGMEKIGSIWSRHFGQASNPEPQQAQSPEAVPEPRPRPEGLSSIQQLKPPDPAVVRTSNQERARAMDSSAQQQSQPNPGDLGRMLDTSPKMVSDLGKEPPSGAKYEQATESRYITVYIERIYQRVGTFGSPSRSHSFPVATSMGQTAYLAIGWTFQHIKTRLSGIYQPSEAGAPDPQRDIEMV